MNPLETKKDYQNYVEEKSPNSPILKNCFNSFWVGGVICSIGQLIWEACKMHELEPIQCTTIVSICLIFLGALLTALNLFNRIGKFAGARLFSSNNRFCKFYCLSIYGIQIWRIYYGSWWKNVHRGWSCSRLWDICINYCAE